MSQNDQLLSLLRQAGKAGIHSHDLRKEYGMGDPGKRASELRHGGHDVFSRIERRGNRHGVRYFLGGSPGLVTEREAPESTEIPEVALDDVETIAAAANDKGLEPSLEDVVLAAEKVLALREQKRQEAA